MSQQSGNSSPLLESVWRFWNWVNIVSWGMSYIGNICTANHRWSFGCNSEVCQFACRVFSPLVLSSLLFSCLVSSCLVLSSLVLFYLPILHNLFKGNISFKPLNWQTNHRPALIITLVQILNIWGHKAYLYMWFTCFIAIQYTKSSLHNTKSNKMQFPICLSFSLWRCRAKKE
jgi:hypothetical protein